MTRNITIIIRQKNISQHKKYSHNYSRVITDQTRTVSDVLFLFNMPVIK